MSEMNEKCQPNVLTPERLKELRKIANDSTQWLDGMHTAERFADHLDDGSPCLMFRPSTKSTFLHQKTMFDLPLRP